MAFGFHHATASYSVEGRDGSPSRPLADSDKEVHIVPAGVRLARRSSPASCPRKTGSALVESLVVMMLLCLILFGILQVSYMIGARNVINYTAVATARSAAIGLNDFMLHKISRFCSIATAGPVRTPQGLKAARPEGESLGATWRNSFSRSKAPDSELGEYELAVREAYHLASVSAFNTILDYDNWQREESDIHFKVEEDNKLDILHVSVEQELPLVYPFSRLFFGNREPMEVQRGDRVDTYPGKLIRAEVTIEDHAELYLK